MARNWVKEVAYSPLRCAGSRTPPKTVGKMKKLQCSAIKIVEKSRNSATAERWTACFLAFVALHRRVTQKINLGGNLKICLNMDQNTKRLQTSEIDHKPKREGLFEYNEKAVRCRIQYCAEKTYSASSLSAPQELSNHVREQFYKILRACS